VQLKCRFCVDRRATSSSKCGSRSRLCGSNISSSKEHAVMQTMCKLKRRPITSADPTRGFFVAYWSEHTSSTTAAETRRWCQLPTALMGRGTCRRGRREAHSSAGRMLTNVASAMPAASATDRTSVPLRDVCRRHQNGTSEHGKFIDDAQQRRPIVHAAKTSGRHRRRHHRTAMTTHNSSLIGFCFALFRRPRRC